MGKEAIIEISTKLEADREAETDFMKERPPKCRQLGAEEKRPGQPAVSDQLQTERHRAADSRAGQGWKQRLENGLYKEASGALPPHPRKSGIIVGNMEAQRSWS